MAAAVLERVAVHVALGPRAVVRVRGLDPRVFVLFHAVLGRALDPLVRLDASVEPREVREDEAEIGFGDVLARGDPHDVHEVAAERGVVRGVRNGNHREARFVERGVGSDGVALVPPQESDRAPPERQAEKHLAAHEIHGSSAATTPREARERAMPRS